jgi:hypothetical protein
MRRCVLNIAAGDKAKREHEITRNNHRAYAEQCCAEYREILRDAIPDFPPAVKYMASKVAAEYDQLLFLDTDTVVMPLAPNIFDEVPLGRWGVVDEGNLLVDESWNETNQRDADRVCHALNIPTIRLMRFINSGVMLMPPDASRWYSPPNKPVPRFWCFEQLYLSMRTQIDRAPLIELDPRWNWCAAWRYFNERKPHAFIVHYAGIEGRDGMLRELLQENLRVTA